MSLDTILSGRCSHEVTRLTVMYRVHTPEVAAALEIIYKEMDKHPLKRNETLLASQFALLEAS